MNATPPAPPPASTPASSPNKVPTHRVEHLGLGIIVLLLFSLLAFRGYGNWIGAKPTVQVAPALTDLNRAARAELEQVPGLGPGLAKRIEDHRRANGPFKSVEDLRQVKGIGPITLDKVRPFLHVTNPSTTSDSLEPLILERRPAVPAPYPRSGGAGGKLQPGDPPIDVNAAGIEELMRIPGVGPVTAQNIVTARTDQPFTSVADLDRVKGIGPKTLEKIRPFVVIR
jgi:competence protein ComEA